MIPLTDTMRIECIYICIWNDGFYKLQGENVYAFYLYSLLKFEFHKIIKKIAVT